MSFRDYFILWPRHYRRRFCAFLFIVGWDNVSCGITIDWRSPNIEIHFLFGFVKLGWHFRPPPGTLVYDMGPRRLWGWQ